MYPTLLTVLLHQYIRGNIKASNEWTELARWLGLPSYFTHRKSAAHLIEDLAQEILYHMDIQSSTDVYRLSWVLEDIATFINDAQQLALLQYLRSIPVPFDNSRGEVA